MNKKRLIVPIHAILILLAYSAPFWLDWRLFLVGVAVNYAQILLAGGCVLSLAQFESKDLTFHEWYLSKLGISVNRRAFNFCLRYVVPFILLGIALLYQVLLGHLAVIKL